MKVMIDHLKADLSAKSEELDAAKKAIAAIRNDFVRRAEDDMVRSSQASRGADNPDSEQLKRITAENRTLHDDNTQLKTRVQRLEREHSGHLDRERASQAELKQAKQQAEAATQSAEALRSQLDQLTTTHRDLVKVHERCKRNDSARDGLQGKVSALERELGEARARVAELEVQAEIPSSLSPLHYRLLCLIRQLPLQLHQARIARRRL
eukprot:m.883318 g.883318  ORF g.883318 m.883318 type:complete len:209 (-) comp59882_c0_seq1:2945-3571(-)